METGQESTTVSQPEKKKRSLRSYCVEISVYIILFVICVYLVPEYVFQRTVVIGESMENTLYDADSLLVEKITKHFTDPDRYDIIIFEPQLTGQSAANRMNKKEYYVKRVIGLPGETVQIKNNDIYIEGKIINDTYAKTNMQKGDEGIAEKPIKLETDQFFVLGDNRAVSLDSRNADLGPIRRGDIVGRAMIRIWPLSRFGILK